MSRECAIAFMIGCSVIAFIAAASAIIPGRAEVERLSHPPPLARPQL